MATITNRNDFKSYCLDNKYSKWYFSIIENALIRGWNKKTSPIYVESHHIIPKSILKNNDTVFLTAREHFICHLLLTKMIEGVNKDKMLYALWNISHHMKGLRKLKINSTTYSSLKEQYIQLSSRKNSGENSTTYGLKGDKHPAFGYKHTEEHKNYIKSLMAGVKNPMYGKKHKESFYIKKCKNYSFIHNNQKVDIFNLRDFCRKNNLDQGAMTRVTTGKQVTHKGYSKWQPQ
jgi:hypothetical protein